MSTRTFTSTWPASAAGHSFNAEPWMNRVSKELSVVTEWRCCLKHVVTEGHGPPASTT